MYLIKAGKVGGGKDWAVGWVDRAGGDVGRERQGWEACSTDAVIELKKMDSLLGSLGPLSLQ